MYLIDQFVTTTPGEAFRLFPFGTVTKNGRSHTITPEMAARFKLPHFKPAIKLGSHKDETPAGGHIVGLEVRADGLYAIPQWNENGTTAVTSGSYRYHSPEVIWEGGGLEDANTGRSLDGPLIVGVALLHMPALGEQAALYSVEKFNGGNRTMSENTITVPTSIWERAWAALVTPQTEPETQPSPPPVDDFTAKVEKMEAQHKAELAAYAAKVEELEAARRRGEQVAHFTAELKETAVADNADLIGILAGLEKGTAEKLVTEFKALSAQIKESNLTQPIGGSAPEGGDPTARLDAAINAYRAEHKVSYSAALQALSASKPELFEGVQDV